MIASTHLVNSRQEIIIREMEDNAFVVNIVEKPYKLKVKSDDIAIFTKASEEIDKTIKTYSTTYGIKDKQDLLSMTLLHFATELARLQKELAQKDSDVIVISDEALKELKEIDGIISKLVQQ